jgi:hypothetical protein
MKRILAILAVVAAIFAVSSCDTALHDGSITLPVKVNENVVVGSDGVTTYTVTAKAGTWSKWDVTIVGMQGINGQEVTLVGQDLSTSDNGTTVSWDNNNGTMSQTVSNGTIHFVFYTNSYPSWNNNIAAWKIVKRNTWDSVVEGMSQTNIQISGTKDKDVVLVIDQLLY